MRFRPEGHSDTCNCTACTVDRDVRSWKNPVRQVKLSKDKPYKQSKQPVYIKYSRYDGICIKCSESFNKNDPIYWHPVNRNVWHFNCYVESLPPLEQANILINNRNRVP